MTCPICGKDSAPKVRPFCSKRCADLDLGRWLNGDYRVPGSLTTDEDAAASEDHADDELRH